MRYKKDISLKIIYFFYFLFLKYPCKKPLNFKIIQLKHATIKIIIIIILKFNSVVDLRQSSVIGQDPGHESGSPESI